MLSRNEFESAVKHALRNCQRADQLRENPLLRARILTRRAGAGLLAEELPVLLAETSGRLFAGARDQKYRRVLELTYFNPAPKQEAAADRLSLPFSTYRRHLTTSVNRLYERDSGGAGQHRSCLGGGGRRPGRSGFQPGFSDGPKR